VDRADLIVLGGTVFAHAGAVVRDGGVAVTAGRVVAVGTAGEIAGFAGSGTEVVDLDGGMVLPGFQDVHIHPVSGGMHAQRCGLHDLEGRVAYRDAIAAYAAAHPSRAWISGGGWSMDAFPGGTPTAAELDAIVADRPVYLVNRDGHGAWVNSRALHLAGIDRTTPDPARGRIERDAAGDPTGTLHEEAADLVGRLVPEPTAAEWEEAVRIGQAHLHRLGITAWQDAMVTPEIEAAYRAVAASDRLTARVEGNLLWEAGRGMEQLEDLVARRDRGPVGRLRLRGVKIFQDGVMENFAAAVREPYLDASGTPTTNRGIAMHEPDELAAMVTALDAAGFQVHIHAIGDRAVGDALDAYAAAAAAHGRRDARHCIAHLQLVHPDDVPRFGALGVVAAAQPYWAFADAYLTDLTIPFIGPERTRWTYPLASLLRAGARLAFGSDWTVSTADPLLEIEVAVTRVDPASRTGPPFLAAERIGIRDALDAFTAGSAFANHLDGTGRIVPGASADLVVLDRDVLDPANGPVGDAAVRMTLVEGDPVYVA
jgi:predicted amidohydrolase YtcJ